MSITELIILSVGLAMDAFAVSICKGLALKKVNLKSMLIVGVWFGAFQGLMPLAGYFLGSQFSRYIEKFDHWIAFVLLALIGIGMIREALSKEPEKEDASLGIKTMFLLAIATSIDALATGVTFAFLNVNIWLAVSLIAAITLVISAAGVKIGSVFGSKYKAKAEFAGGTVLILLGLKILLEHLGILNL